ncbi:MAG: exosortase A [Candidatus Sulfotelmatobacter sp.]
MTAPATETAQRTSQKEVGRYFRRVAEHWRLIVLVGAVLAVFGGVLAGLVQDWWGNADYSHGFFVPILSLYLVWRKREELSRLSPRPNAWGMSIVLFSLGLLWLGSLGAELFLTRIAIVGTMAGLIVYFAGWKMLRSLAFPVAFLLLMIPLPTLIYNEIVFPLQLLASRLAGGLLDYLNFFPVVREGNILVLPHSRLEVVEACSGIRSLMSLITLAVGYGYLAENNRWIRLALVVSIVPVAVVSNGVRVVGTAFATYYLGPKIADGFLHSFSGWVIFLIASTLLLMLHVAMKFFRRDRTNSL